MCGVSGLAMGYAYLGKMLVGGSPPKLDCIPCDVDVVIIDVAITTKYMIIKKCIIAVGILK